MSKKNFNKLLREKLRNEKISLSMLAFQLDIPDTTLKNWINRNKYPKSSFNNMCKYLGITSEEAEEKYNFGYVDDYRSSVRIKRAPQDFKTMEEAREYTNAVLYRTAIRILNDTFTRDSDKKQNIINDLEQIVKKYKGK